MAMAVKRYKLNVENEIGFNKCDTLKLKVQCGF